MRQAQVARVRWVRWTTELLMLASASTFLRVGCYSRPYCRLRSRCACGVDAIGLRCGRVACAAGGASGACGGSSGERRH